MVVQRVQQAGLQAGAVGPLGLVGGGGEGDFGLLGRDQAGGGEFAEEMRGAMRLGRVGRVAHAHASGTRSSKL